MQDSQPAESLENQIKMTIFYGRGGPEEVITPRDAKEALDVAFEQLGKRCGGTNKRSMDFSIDGNTGKVYIQSTR